MHDRSMIINGSTQKASKVHILSTKTVQCLLPSCRVATCGDRALQSCYSGKYYVFVGIRRPLTVTKNSKNSQLSRLSTFSTFSMFSMFSTNSRLSLLSTPSPAFHRCKPRQGQQLIAYSLQQMNCHKYNKLSLIVINCLIIKNDSSTP